MNERLELVKEVLKNYFYAVEVISRTLLDAEYCDELKLDGVVSYIIYKEYSVNNVNIIELSKEEIQARVMKFIEDEKKALEAIKSSRMTTEKEEVQ